MRDIILEQTKIIELKQMKVEFKEMGSKRINFENKSELINCQVQWKNHFGPIFLQNGLHK